MASPRWYVLGAQSHPAWRSVLNLPFSPKTSVSPLAFPFSTPGLLLSPENPLSPSFVSLTLSSHARSLNLHSCGELLCVRASVRWRFFVQIFIPLAAYLAPNIQSLNPLPTFVDPEFVRQCLGPPLRRQILRFLELGIPIASVGDHTFRTSTIS